MYLDRTAGLKTDTSSPEADRQTERGRSQQREGRKRWRLGQKAKVGRILKRLTDARVLGLI